MLGESEDKVEKLWANVEYLNNGFKQLGFDIGHSETPIIPVRVRSRRSRNPLACNVLCESTKMSVAGNAGRRGAREGIRIRRYRSRDRACELRVRLRGVARREERGVHV